MTKMPAGAKRRRSRGTSRRSRAHAIAARLEAEIIAGERKPRERLVELDLAARFRVSRAPVREALRLLERDGLVASDTRGVHVADVTPQEVADVFEILAHLTELYTARAAPHVTTGALGRMRAILAEMTVAAGDNDVRRYFDLNIDFHAVIREACPNRRLIDLLGALGKPTLRYRHLAMSLPGRLSDSLEEHHRIVAALEAGDAETAGRRARESAERAFAELSRFLRDNPQLV